MDIDNYYLQNGLSPEEVQAKIAAGEVNNTGASQTKPVYRIVLEHSLTLFNLVNVVLAIMVALVGSFKNMLFMGIIISNTVIGVVQELRSKRSVDKLSIMVASKIEVIRGGKMEEIATEEIVQDDLIRLKRGSQIPVDAVVLSGSADVNESLVTGESDLIHKGEGDELLSGSFLAGGDCMAKVTKVGRSSFAAKISREAKVVKNAESEIMRTLKKIITIISCCLIPLGIILFNNQINLDGATLQTAVVATVAALVTMIPEGLMLLTSSVLAVAVIRLSQKNVLVQQLYCIETLARVDVICLDKTGTITTGRMKVTDLLPLNGFSRREGDDGFLRLAAVSRDESPTTNAIRACFGSKHTVKATHIVDFSSEKKWSGARFEDGTTLVMGAGEMIFKESFKQIENSIKDRIGMNRVIMLAKTSAPFPEGDTLPEGLVPIAALLIQDEIRKEAPTTIQYFLDQGVNIKVISGDGVETVSHIAAAAGVPNANRRVDMRPLVEEKDVEAVAEDTVIFGRVTPQQKRQLIRSLQKNGHTVAMTGDGVNDVLAMKESDCSVAMASGSDAARNIAQLVLTTDDFSAMPQVVAEGRRSINNIQRSASLFLTKTLFSMLLGLFFAVVTLRYPFQPIQMTFISGLTIGFPSFVLALQPNHERIRGNFFYNIITRAVAGGVTMFVGIILAYTASFIFDLTFEQLAMLCVIVTAMTGVFLLFRISYPFDTVRAILFGLVLIGLVVGSFVLHDLLGFGTLSWGTAISFLVICLINAFVFFVLFHFMEEIRLKKLEENPNGGASEARRRQLEKRAEKKEKQLQYQMEREEAYKEASKPYKGLVRAAAVPVSFLMTATEKLRQKLNKSE